MAIEQENPWLHEKPPKRILICGPRDFSCYFWVFMVVAGCKKKYGDDITIIHGGARGVDSLVDKAAKALDLTVDAYPANWKKYGAVAGPIRNRDMYEKSKPDRVISVGRLGTPGTTDMCNVAYNGGTFVIRRYFDASFA